MKTYDKREQSSKPNGPQEHEGTAGEMGEKGIRASDAGMGQAGRQAKGKRHEDKESEVIVSIYKRGGVY